MLLAYTLFFAIVFLPILPIYSVEGVSSVIRLDFLLSLVLVLGMLRDLGFRRHLVMPNSLLIAILIISIYFYSSLNIFISMAQISLYFSMYCSYYLGCQAVKERYIICIKLIYILLATNCFIHLIYYFLQIDSISINHINGIGQVENDIAFGLFGISKMPFQFIIYIAAFLFISLFRFGYLTVNLIFTLVLFLVSSATSESRIGFFALFIGFLFTLKPAKATAVLLLSMLITPFVLTDKMSFIYNMDLSSIMNDSSLGMRLTNLENFINWLTPERVLLGGGAFAHLQFTSTYGEPGALDILFVRLLAEFGFLIFSVSIIYFFLNLQNILKNHNPMRRRLIFGWISFIFIYSILNEGVIASRSGHLFFFVLGLLFSAATKPMTFFKES